MQLNNKDIEEIKLGNIDCIAAYLGTNKVFAKDLGVYTSFSSSILPTVWEKTSNTTAKATTSYGTWYISATTTYSETTGVELAFDNDLTTCAKSSNYRNDYDITITCPTGVTIRPQQLTLTAYRLGTTGGGSTFKGGQDELINFDEDFYDNDEILTKGYAISTSNYYSKFTLHVTVPTLGGYMRNIYNILINKGIVRVEK